MFRFRRNVTVIAVETQDVRDKIDGPTRRWTHLQRYSLDAAVIARETEGGYLARVIHRMGVGRVTVQHISPHAAHAAQTACGPTARPCTTAAADHPPPERSVMFVNIPPAVVRPAGVLIYAVTSTGGTCRFRAGLPVEIWRAETFRVFVGGVFIDGWFWPDEAIKSADRF